jgi:hypothetical protein
VRLPIISIKQKSVANIPQPYETRTSVLHHRQEMSYANNNPAHTSSESPERLIEGTVWDVQVLAERRMADGESEVLVLWTPSWIAKKYLHSDCPAMRKFKEAPKARFGVAEALGALILPIEPGTKMADDCARAQRQHAAALATGECSGADRKANRNLTQRARKTPQQLDGVAKKTASNHTKRQRQSRTK